MVRWWLAFSGALAAAMFSSSFSRSNPTSTCCSHKTPCSAWDAAKGCHQSAYETFSTGKAFTILTCDSASGWDGAWGVAVGRVAVSPLGRLVRRLRGLFSLGELASAAVGRQGAASLPWEPAACTPRIISPSKSLWLDPSPPSLAGALRMMSYACRGPSWGRFCLLLVVCRGGELHG